MYFAINWFYRMYFTHTWKFFTALKWACCLILFAKTALGPWAEADFLKATCKGCFGPSLYLEVAGLGGVTGILDDIFLAFRSRIILSLTDSGLFGILFWPLSCSDDGNDDDSVELDEDREDLVPGRLEVFVLGKFEFINRTKSVNFNTKIVEKIAEKNAKFFFQNCGKCFHIFRNFSEIFP